MSSAWQLEADDGVIRLLRHGEVLREVAASPVGPPGVAVRALACSSRLDQHSPVTDEHPEISGSSFVHLLDTTGATVATLPYLNWCPERPWWTPTDPARSLEAIGVTALLRVAGIPLRIVTGANDPDLAVFRRAHGPHLDWQIRDGDMVSSVAPGIEALPLATGFARVGRDLVVRQGDREAWFPIGGPTGLDAIGLPEDGTLELRGPAPVARLWLRARDGDQPPRDELAGALATGTGMRVDRGGAPTVTTRGLLDPAQPDEGVRAQREHDRPGLFRRLFG